MSGKYKYLFGPVLSRRLGRSLGVDVTPLKACSLDCIFCQCGNTAYLVTERAEFVPFSDVCAELEQWLAEDGHADYITFAGSGEPTLYSRLGELITFIKERTKIPVVVLSNGTLFHRLDVCEEAAKADIVKMSLSAWDDASFQRVNRPAPGLLFETVLAGQRNFRRLFSGRLWLEVFLIEGINANRTQIEKIAEIATEIAPDKIHLNTAVRPPAEDFVYEVTEEKLYTSCNLFTPRAEVAASFNTQPDTQPGLKNNDGANHTISRVVDESLADLIPRHPSTEQQLAEMCGVDTDTVRELLAPLIEEGLLQVEDRDGITWYK